MRTIVAIRIGGFAKNLARARMAQVAIVRRGNGGPNGPGWGGPAKGTSASKRHEFYSPGPGRGHYSQRGEARTERQARHAEEMHQILYEFAHDAKKADAIRISAATHLLNRIEGLPIAKVATAVTDPYSMMTDEQLDSERKSLQARVDAYERLKRGDGQ